MNLIEIIIRLLLSIIIGGMIGYEREFKHKTAGFRTHILVCVGAAVTSMIQMNSIYNSAAMIEAYPNLKGILGADTGRLGAQVISGVGFLGAGAIIHDRGLVRGLTTAASVWVVACIGLAVGLGYYSISILSALSVFITLVALKKFEIKLFMRTNKVQLQVDFIGSKEIIRDIVKYFNDRSIKTLDIEILSNDKKEASEIDSLLYTVRMPSSISISDIKEEMYSSLSVVNIKVIE